jgi:hypothetical protein
VPDKPAQYIGSRLIRIDLTGNQIFAVGARFLSRALVSPPLRHSLRHLLLASTNLTDFGNVWRVSMFPASKLDFPWCHYAPSTDSICGLTSATPTTNTNIHTHTHAAHARAVLCSLRYCNTT